MRAFDDHLAVAVNHGATIVRCQKVRPTSETGGFGKPPAFRTSWPSRAGETMRSGSGLPAAGTPCRYSRGAQIRPEASFPVWRPYPLVGIFVVGRDGE